MKYERLTKETVGSFGYDLKDFEHKPKEFNDYDAFYAYKMAVKRLGELEDKIERGELIERTSEEYSAVRKQAVEEFAEKLRDKRFFVEIGSRWFAVVKSRDIKELVKEVCGE